MFLNLILLVNFCHLVNIIIPSVDFDGWVGEVSYKDKENDKWKILFTFTCMEGSFWPFTKKSKDNPCMKILDFSQLLVADAPL